MSVETANTSQVWHAQQRARATGYQRKTKHTEIPGNYRCAGDCTTEVPNPPGAEPFVAEPPPPPTYWLILAAAALSYLTLTLWKVKR